MENRLFAEGYQKPPNHVAFNDDTPEVHELMTGPRLKASFFDSQMHRYLQGEKSENSGDVYEELYLYNRVWLSEHLENTVKTGREIAFRNPENDRQVNELNFHTLNRGFAPLWRRLLVPEVQGPLGADQVHELQTRLAIEGVALAIARKKYAGKEAEEGLGPIVSFKIDGQLTEIDTGITLLEMVKDDSFNDSPSLVVVPAPPQFEAGYKNGNRAADFLITDTDQKVTRGIQTKTFIDSIEGSTSVQDYSSQTMRYIEPTRKYDADYITLVDGMTDLGNSKTERTRHRGLIPVPAPGLIALNFMKFHVSIKEAFRNPLLNKHVGALIHAREVSKQLSNSKSSYLIQAKKNIEGRILHDLHKKK